MILARHTPALSEGSVEKIADVLKEAEDREAQR
jgi:hypothetical protein